MQASVVHPIPDKTVKIIVVPAIGIAGVPAAAQIDKNAITIMLAGVTSIPAAVAMNVTANMCITVVPFILIVIPVGSTKLVISSLHPSSSIQVLVFSGRQAAEEFVENPNTPTFAIFFKNFTGFSLVVIQIPSGYKVTTNKNNVSIAKMTYAAAGARYSTP